MTVDRKSLNITCRMNPSVFELCSPGVYTTIETKKLYNALTSSVYMCHIQTLVSGSQSGYSILKLCHQQETRFLESLYIPVLHQVVASF